MILMLLSQKNRRFLAVAAYASAAAIGRQTASAMAMGGSSDNVNLKLILFLACRFTYFLDFVIV